MSAARPPIPSFLVAHRGLAAREIENTLPALEAAADAGAIHIEVDVQLSQDGIPVLYHDRDLQRLAGIPGPVANYRSQELGKLTLNQEGRPPAPLAPLSALVSLLQRHPALHVFVELKRVAIASADSDTLIAAVTDTLAPVLSRCTLISYDYDAVATLKQRGLPVGWVVEGDPSAWRQQADKLQADYVFADIEDISLPLPAAPWQWVIFEVTDPAIACRLIRAGNTLVESFDIAGLTNSLSPDCLP